MGVKSPRTDARCYWAPPFHHTRSGIKNPQVATTFSSIETTKDEDLGGFVETLDDKLVGSVIYLIIDEYGSVASKLGGIAFLTLIDPFCFIIL